MKLFLSKRRLLALLYCLTRNAETLITW